MALPYYTEVTLGADFLAQPPMTVAYNNSAAFWAMVVYGLGCLVMLIRAWMRKGEGPITTAMFLGAATASIIEPGIDILTGCFHPVLGQGHTVFTLMGRSMPIWLILGYALYYGANGSMMLMAFNKGITRRGVWIWVLAPMVFNYAIEYVMLHAGLYYYYGNQPFVVTMYPLYQMACNGTGLLLGLLVLYFLQPLLKGWKLYAGAVVLMPLCAAMGYCGAGFPSFFAVHSTWPNWAVQLSGVATFTLFGLVVHGVSYLVSVDSPLHGRMKSVGFHLVVAKTQ